MMQKDTRKEHPTVASHRRKMIKALSVSGTALALKEVPDQWSRPTVASVLLPAHANVSACEDACNITSSTFTYAANDYYALAAQATSTCSYNSCVFTLWAGSLTVTATGSPVGSVCSVSVIAGTLDAPCLGYSGSATVNFYDDDRLVCSDVADMTVRCRA